MANNRVIGVELVVDDQGTVKLIKFAESAKQAFGQAEQSAEGLDQAMKKGGQQAKSAEGAMEQVERRAGSLAGRVNVLSASFKRLQQAGGLVWSTTKRIASGIFSLQGALVGLGLGYVAHDFLKVADNTERMKIALDQLTNGKGEEWFRKLNDWAFKMPVNTDKAIEAFIRLRAFGLEPTIKQMTTLVDSTIGVGRGEEALESVSRALGQIQARGKLSAEELNQLAEAGISAKSMLADAFGVSVAELEKLIAKGIDSKVAIAALFDQLEARFGGASSKIQQKYSGLMDALISHWRDFQRQMMESGVIQAIEAGLGGVIARLDDLRSSGRIAEWADKSGKAIEGLINRAVNFIDSIINNWSQWEARWEKFKSGASEVWTQTKNVASVVGSLLKIALDGWNNLPPVVREFGLVGALIGGVKGKIIFAAIVGLSALLDKAKEVSKGEPDLHIGGVTVPGSPERGYLFKFRQWLEELKGQKPTQSLRELNAGYYQKDYYPTGPMGGDMGGATAQGLADLGIPELELPAATSTAGTSPSKTSPTRFTVPTGDDEKALAKREAAGLKAVKEYMAAVEEANKLEVSLRQETMTSYERSFDDLERGYTATYDKIEDLEYRGAITSEQALGMRRQASSNYLTARDKMEADHNRSLLHETEAYHLEGKALAIKQLQWETQALLDSGKNKELVMLRYNQKLADINQSLLSKMAKQWMDFDAEIEASTKQMVSGIYSSLKALPGKALYAIIRPDESAERALENARKALNIYDKAVREAGGNQDKLKTAVDNLKNSYPGLVDEYGNVREAMDQIDARRSQFLQDFEDETGWTKALKDVWQDTLDAMLKAFTDWVGDILFQIAKAGIADALKAMFNIGKGGNLSSLFGSLFGNSQNPAAEVTGSAANSAIGAGLWAGAKALGAKAAAALGLPSVAAWLGATTATATTAAVPSSVALSGVLGPEAAAALAPTAATTTATTAATGTGASGAMTGSMAAFLASPAGAMALGVLPGMIGMVFGKQIDSLFGWDGGLTPEEAMSNWEGQSAFIENIAKSLDGLAPTLSGVNQEFGMFSEAAQDAALDFERLETVAGLTKEQLDAMRASLSPTAQAFLDSGIKARNLNNEVSRLTQEMNAAINSYAMTSDAVNMYNDRIDKLAADMGLTGAAANKFKNEIWDLANSFSQGGEEAGRFDKALSDFVGQTLGSIAEGANSASEAVGGLIGTMQSASVVGNTFSSSLPRGDISAPASAYSSVGVYHQGGLVRHSGGGIGNWGWIGYEELMRLAGDEVLTKLRLGEYVVQAGAVNSLTGPWLDQLNDTGQPPVLAAPVPVPMPVATSGPAGQGNRTVNIQEGAVTVVVQGGDMDEDALALRLRDRLAELARDAFEAV